MFTNANPEAFRKGTRATLLPGIAGAPAAGRDGLRSRPLFGTSAGARSTAVRRLGNVEPTAPALCSRFHFGRYGASAASRSCCCSSLWQAAEPVAGLADAAR